MNRNEAIDILKFVAVILVAHSHMDVLYPRYSYICTGGAIGDALFFFISGYTLFLSQWGRFDNWYKKRIQRIYPTILAWAIIACAIFGVRRDAVDVMLSGGGYFVSCIMVFYALIYWVGRYLKNYIRYIILLTILVIVGVYVFWANAITDNVYSSLSVMWPLWNFIFMLVGASVSIREHDGKPISCQSFGKELLFVISYLISYYSLLYAARILDAQWLQLVGLVPLIGLVIHLYVMLKSEKVQNVYHFKGCNLLIFSLGQLCLEVYIVQPYLFSNRWNDYFPFNVFGAWIAVFALAYLLKVGGNFVAQTFKAEDYDWRKMIRL